MKPFIPIFVKALTLTLVLFFPSRQLAQLSIGLSSVTCNSLIASANTGTLTANTFSWSILPLGPVIYSSTTQNTIIRFPQSGSFTLSLLAQTPQGNVQTSQTLSIIAIPSLTISASPDTVCWTQSSTISAGGAVNYSWAPSIFLSSTNTSITVTTPSTSLIYTLTANNALYCTNTNTVLVAFVSTPNPTIFATSSNICIGSTATLTAYWASYFTWSGTTFTGAVANQSIVVGPGTYTVLGSNGDDCKAEANITIIGIPCPNSIFELNTALGLINLFPNPTAGVFFISSDNSNLNGFEIVDVFGKIVLSEDQLLPKNEVLEVDLRPFPNGLYFVKIDLDDGLSRTLKLIKD
jgi:hypothetical protein